jgi:hypothetical protein
MLHEPRRRRSWLIFDVRPYSSTMDIRAPASRRVRRRRVNSGRIGISSFPGLKSPAKVLGMRSRFFSPACAAPVAVERSFRDQRFGRSSSVSLSSRVDAIFPRRIGPPNKAPEPTITSVTPRAILRMTECSSRIARCFPARVVPAVIVAHL